MVGPPAQSAQEAAGPKIEITGATINLTGQVVATLRVTRGGVPVATPGEVSALGPMFTLAGLSTHPVDGVAAWRSFLLTGGQTIPSLPLDPPGAGSRTALTAVKQPGAEATGTLAGANGTFTYTYRNALPASACPTLDRQCFDQTETIRVGVWLLENGTADGTSTYDFRPLGGAAAAAPRDVALHESCQACHDAIRSPRGAVGVKICTTCHTWQNADPDTSDPAALYPASPSADPNPLDLGRMIHRIHRGKNLPTLYAASSTAATPVPPLPPPSAPPLPFFPGRNAPIVGRKYSIVGPSSREVIFGRVLARPDFAQANTKTVAAGVTFPRDLRDCAVCHEGAPQGYEVLYGISRRTCAGCHPDVWYAVDVAPITDTVHLAHTGGPQPDDGQCRGCHVAAMPPAQPRVWAPIADIHVTPYKSPRFDRPTVEIVAVDDLQAGKAPTIKFRLYDDLGTISPPRDPTPRADPRPLGSPVSRALTPATEGGTGYFGISLAGPTAPAFGRVQVMSTDVGTGNPDPFTLLADADGVFTYTFGSTVPAGASRTWVVGLEARRRTVTVNWDASAQTFRWPYTGEALGETPRNALAYVDTGTGRYREDEPDPAVVPRRKVVDEEKCNRCHERIAIHGTVRMRVEYCLVCHGPEKTDYDVRPKVGGVATAPVNLGATYDGIEERSIDFKVMIHRIHTGAREGSASLAAIEPFVIYGKGGSVWYFDEGSFPGDLRDCTLCHEGRTYAVESVPADAPPTVANETSTVLHQGNGEHVGCRSTPPIQAACAGCHASGFTERHGDDHTVDGVEQCAQCHVRGALSVDVAHGLAPEGSSPVSASFTSIVQNIIVPRCASAACHGGNPPAAFPQLDADAAYAAIVNVPSQQASGLDLVEPFEPANSYFLVKIRGEGASVGGIATPMPTGDAALDAGEIAAVEGWIANGAPND
ncbi:MAG TPA: OmcA/MtrC family decaheme c-type cytochrome [Anaeromyxobacter sp.]|nr:OmcA/MtrC family decaheme c-type cytochrome [Anaeromyxobacter sp.]